MLKLKEELRDQIVGFLGEVSVPVKVASNFLGIINALNALPKEEEKPEESNV
jgi:hypothetical protein